MNRTLKNIGFSFILISGSLVLVGALLLAADTYCHYKFKQSAGLNYRGYRGDVVPKKKNDEIRVVVLGGSTVFGYGVRYDESFPYYLEKLLNANSTETSFSVVNLGMNSVGAYSFVGLLEDYLNLDYDLAILYEGYNDTDYTKENYHRGRRNSPLFRLTGYFPILQEVLTEKAMLLKHGGDISSAYQNKTVFNGNLAQRVAGDSLSKAVTVINQLENQLNNFDKQSKNLGAVRTPGHCGPKWNFYCTQIVNAVRWGQEHQKKMMVVSQPYLTGSGHREQQTELAAELKSSFSNVSGFKYVNLGEAILLTDEKLAFDGMHLLPKGNQLIAERLQPEVLQLAKEPARLSR